MDYDDYLKDRLKPQINWYSRKSTFNKRIFLGLSTFEILAAASIPLLVGFAGEAHSWARILVGSLGALVAVTSGVMALNKYQELWLQYRSTCEALEHEKYLFETGTKPYDDDDAFHLLVQNAENLMLKEHSRWQQFGTRRKKSTTIKTTVKATQLPGKSKE